MTIDVKELMSKASSRLGGVRNDLVKGVKGLTSNNKVPETLEKGLLRAKFGLSVFKDGTVRFDVGQAQDCRRMAPMREHARETRSLAIALIAYCGLFILQFVSYFLTNMLVLFAQALEVLSDVFISAFLLLTLFWSRKPADELHMFGHGRAQNVAGLVSATVLVLFMSVETLREAVPRLFQAKSGLSQDTNLALLVTIVSMAIVAVSIIDILRVKERGASVKAQLVSLVKDEASYAIAFGAILLVGQGYLKADPLASTIVGFITALGGVYLFKDNVHYLLGRSPGREFMARVESAARSVNGVLGVHDLRAEYIGPNVVHAGFHIEVAKGTPIEEADRVSKEVHEKVRQETGCQHCVIHVEPANA